MVGCGHLLGRPLLCIVVNWCQMLPKQEYCKVYLLETLCGYRTNLQDAPFHKQHA